MTDLITIRWLPVDTVLGAEISAATDTALAPLAAHARRVRRTAIRGTALLFGSAVVLALLATGPGGWVFGFAAVAAATFGAFLAVQTHRLWGESPNWMARRSRPAPVPELPEPAALLLFTLRSGRRRARYRRALSGRDIEIRSQMLRGPFGPLLMSSSPDIQSLALVDWLGGDQLWIEIENDDFGRVAADGDEAAGDPAGEPVRDPAKLTSLKAAARFAGANPLGLDHRLLMPPEALGNLLERAYPIPTRSRRDALVVDALMLGNELVYAGLVPEHIKTMVARVVAGLKKPDEHAVSLVADNGSTALQGYQFAHRKAFGAGYSKVGLTEGSDSARWIELLFAGRYEKDTKKLDAAEEMLSAP